VAPASRPPRPNPQARRLVLRTLVAACVLLAAWVVVLALRLPKRYSAPHWDLAWVGFDVALLCFLAATAWAAWKRRAVIVVFGTVTATLLCADVWFDVTTARSSEVWLSVAQALFVELPFAAFLMVVVVRVINFTRGALWDDHADGTPGSLWSVEFPRVAEVEVEHPGGPPAELRRDGEQG
jgi:hypothetical protein